MPGIPTVAVDQLPTPLPEGVTVLDVREPIEWHHGHVEGSLHLPMMEVPQHLGDLPVDGQLLVVCKVGGRSAQVVQYLQQQGLDAVNLDGGLLEWSAAGRPLVSDAGDPFVA
jgi:rhodanese-related sulfurtransferase